MQTHGAKFGIVLGFFKDKTDQNISLSLKWTTCDCSSGRHRPTALERRSLLHHTSLPFQCRALETRSSDHRISHQTHAFSLPRSPSSFELSPFVISVSWFFENCARMSNLLPPYLTIRWIVWTWIPAQQSRDCQLLPRCGNSEFGQIHQSRIRKDYFCPWDRLQLSCSFFSHYDILDQCYRWRKIVLRMTIGNDPSYKSTHLITFAIGSSFRAILL
jgi:hypothetical protein